MGHVRRIINHRARRNKKEIPEESPRREVDNPASYKCGSTQKKIPALLIGPPSLLYAANGGTVDGQEANRKRRGSSNSSLPLLTNFSLVAGLSRAQFDHKPGPRQHNFPLRSFWPFFPLLASRLTRQLAQWRHGLEDMARRPVKLSTPPERIMDLIKSGSGPRRF